MTTSPIALTFSKEAPFPPLRNNSVLEGDVVVGQQSVSSKDSSLKDEATVEKQDDTLGRPLSRIDTSDFPTAYRLAMIMIALLLSIFLCALDMTIIGTAIPRITDEFHSLSEVGWYGSAFFLTIAAFQSPWGKVYKYFPLKISYLASILIFEVGSLVCGVAKNSTTLIVGRAVAGVGGAGIASGAYTIIAFSVVPAKRPAFTGLMGTVFAVASAVGPLLGGVFTDRLTWRWCFYINLPIGGLAALFIFIFFQTPKAARPQEADLKEKLLQLDLPGAFVLMASMTCLFLALQNGGTTKPWNNGTIIAELTLFGIILLGFVAIEYFSGDRALIQGRLIKDRTIGGLSAFIFAMSGANAILLYFLPIYFQVTRNDTAQASGIKNLPLVLGASIFAVVCGVVITVTGLYIPIMVVGSALTAVGCGLLYTLDINSGAGQWLGYQSIVGIGLGLICQVPIIVCQAVVRASDLSSVSAMVLFFQTIGCAIWLSAGQAGFANKMLKEVAIRVPDVNPGLVLATGATNLRKFFTPEQLVGILQAYMAGLRIAFVVTIACASLTFLLSVSPRWENLKGKINLAGNA